MDERVLRVGHSPDADDAFMFYGFASGAVCIDGFRIEHVMEDIESLNRRALAAELEVTAISAHAYPQVAHAYWIMAAGSSMGEGYGPVVVAREPMSPEDLRGRRVATPGELTTARLLSGIYLEDSEPVDMDFDRIFDAVTAGEVDAGVVIHEGQLTYGENGLAMIMDFGRAWADETGLPLPLGLDMVRKDLGVDLGRRISVALQQSIRFGYEHQEQSIPYAMQFGRGIDSETGTRFVKMYVNELTINMGERGRAGLEHLFRRARERGLIDEVPAIELIGEAKKRGRRVGRQP